MEESQFIELIKVILPEERDDLLQFAGLKQFNNDRMAANVAPLIQICLTYSWGDQSFYPSKLDIYRKLFPQDKFVEGKLEKVMVEAQRLVKAYLVAKHYFRGENEFQQTLDFAESIRRRGLNDRFQLILSRLHKMQSEFPYRNAQYYHQQLLLESLVHYVDSFNNQGKGDINLHNLLLATESYNYQRRVSLLNRYLLQQKITKLAASEFIFHLLDSTPSTIAKFIQGSSHLDINTLIFHILKKDVPDYDDLIFLHQEIKNNEEKIDPETLQEFYAYLRNFTVLLIETDVSNCQIKVFLHHLYSDSLTRGYLHYEGKIQSSRYIAVTSNALAIKEFDWANSFIECNKDIIHGENETKDIYRFNKAEYYFAIGEYEKCLDLLPPVSPFVNYLIRGKRLEMKALYETQSDLLSYRLDSFKMFLSRTSPKLLSDSRRQSNIEFANMLTQLTSSISGDKKRSEKLMNRLKQKTATAEWPWLFAKAQSLK